MQRLLGADVANAAVKSRWTQLAHGRMHHLEAGAGEPVVLLHGGTGGGANWFRQIGRLSSRCRVLAPDMPGYGMSGRAVPELPLGRAAAHVFEDWFAANDVSRALVVGTSFGGLVALRLAVNSPGRVARLLLLDAAGLGRGIHPAVRLAATAPLARVALRPTLSGTRLQLSTLLTSDRSRLNREVQAALAAYLYETGVAAGIPYLSLTLRMFIGPNGQREVLADDELRSIRQPVSIVWGQRDRLIPVAHAHRTAGILPHARLTIIPRAGHSPNWEAPDDVLDAIHQLADEPAGDEPAADLA
ncbi:alpha/beta fold hydrolase [soil metagenome]